jgi:4-hydroxybenzoyl-CoA reductase subunit beta
MLRLPAFTYVSPKTVEQAVRAIADAGPDAMLVAGGTDLYPNMKRRQFEPRTLVGLRAIRELRGVTGSPRQGLTIGACTTLTTVAAHPDVARAYAGLAAAAGLVSSPQLRNMGTLGGNVCVDTRCNYYNQSFEWRKAIGFCMKKDGDICLVAPGSDRCWAVSSSDTAPALWSLDARVTLAGPAGERTVPIAALYRDDGIDYLTKRPEELLVRVEVPALDGTRATYRKLRRRGAFDFPVLGVAAWARFDAQGRVAETRLVLGAVGSYPKASAEAVSLLTGQPLSDDVIDRAALAAARPAKPLDNTDFTIGWRKDMVPVFIRRALEDLR